MDRILESFRWVRSSRQSTLEAQQRLLHLGGVSGIVVPVDTSIDWTWRGRSSTEVIHSLEGGSNDAPPLVYWPGYAAGSAFIFRNLRRWASTFSVKAVDFLGTGLSSRPNFKASSTREAEDFFIESFELWRQKRGLDKFTLVGHSMGGYLAANYAMRYPERIDHLVLVCPAGVGSRPADFEDRIPDALKNPFTLRGMLFRTARSLWDWGATPGGFIRGLGPLGKKLVVGYTQRRFVTGNHLSEEEVAALSEYMYGIVAAKGSGEYALRHILEPFAFARSPLESRLSGLSVPVTFIYGESDWMDRKAGQRALDSIKKSRKILSEGDCRLVEIPQAGHYVQIEQKDLFYNELLGCLGMDVCREVQEEAGGPIETEEELAGEWERGDMRAAVDVVSGL